MDREVNGGRAERKVFKQLMLHRICDVFDQLLALSEGTRII